VRKEAPEVEPYASHSASKGKPNNTIREKRQEKNESHAEVLPGKKN